MILKCNQLAMDICKVLGFQNYFWIEVVEDAMQEVESE